MYDQTKILLLSIECRISHQHHIKADKIRQFAGTDFHDFFSDISANRKNQIQSIEESTRQETKETYLHSSQSKRAKTTVFFIRELYHPFHQGDQTTVPSLEATAQQRHSMEGNRLHSHGPAHPFAETSTYSFPKFIYIKTKTEEKLAKRF